MGLAIRPLVQILIRAVLGILCAVLLVGAAILATNLTTAPKAISLLFEPISLLLMPGLLVSMLTSGPHDYSPHFVAYVSFVFYAVFFYGVLHWLSRRRNP
jgi:hypothetical protein